MARRVRAELGSAGREAVILERRTPLGNCTSRPATEDAPGQVGVILQTERGGIVRAEICANPEPNQVTVVTARGRLDKEGDFAIVVTEALHGLLLAPSSEPTLRAPKESLPASSDEARKEEPDETTLAPSLSLGARTVLDAGTGDYWAGVFPRVEVPLHGRFALEADFLLGLRPISYADEVVELESHIAWARLGLSSSGGFGPFWLGWDASAGLFSNRATATAVSPRRGGSDGAFGAVLGAGGYARYPATGWFYISGSVGVSTLVPRLDYQLSEDTTPPVGALLLDGGLSLGIRLERAMR